MDAVSFDGKTFRCEDEPFDSGADGKVYWTLDGKYLVKIYKSPESWREESVKALLNRFNIVRDEPFWNNLLCWPVAVVRLPSLGVVVPRARMKKYANLVLPKWLKYHPEDIGNFYGRTLIAMRISLGVRRLHFSGLCHSDLSENNIFANPTDGSAYIIDLDGLVVPGLSIARPVVQGTSGYIAPELVANRMVDPSVQSDLHALAVLIYQVLMVRHPLRGRKVHHNDPEVDEMLTLGAQALFIENQADASNRPVNLPYSYKVLGTEVGRLIERAFVEGLHSPSKRPLAVDWERALTRMYDTIIPCLNPACSFKSFPLQDLPSGRGNAQCPWCKHVIRGFTVPIIRWFTPSAGQAGVYRPDGTRKVAWPGSKLYDWHIQPNSLPTAQSNPSALAEIRQMQDRFGAHWVLVNLGMPLIEAADPGGAWKRIPQNQAVELKHGRKLRFGPPGQARDGLVEMVQLI